MAKTTIGAHSVVFDGTGAVAGTVAKWENAGGVDADITVDLVHGLNASFPGGLEVVMESVDTGTPLNYAKVVSTDANTVRITVKVTAASSVTATVRVRKPFSTVK